MFIQLLEKRRSIRKYQKKRIETEKIDVLVEAALRPPSSRGLQPWEFVLVSKRDLLEKLSKAREHGSFFLKDAQLAIVICADPKKTDVWVEDSSIAAVFIQLAAESVGLGSCWVQVRERMHDASKTASAYVSEILNIPSGLTVECMIGIGYPDEQKPPRKKEELAYGKVHQDVYGNAYISSK